MDTSRLVVFVREVTVQGEAAHLAVSSYDSAINNYDTRGAFAAVQALLGAGASISKLLWPTPPDRDQSGKPLEGEALEQRARTKARGRALRDALKVKSIPVLEKRAVRNAFEHFDTRLDEFLEVHSFVMDRVVGDIDAAVKSEFPLPPALRRINPRTGTVGVLEDELDLQELIHAIDDIVGRAHAWLDENQRPTR